MRTIKELTRAIDLNPSEPDNFHRRGWAYYELNKYEKAIEDITKAIDLKSDNPYSYHLRGWANYKLKKYEKALKDTKKAIELNSNEPRFFDLIKAIEDATKVNKPECTYLEKIKKYFFNEDYEKTIRQCNEAINSNKEIADYYLYRGLSKQYSNKVYKNNSILNDFNIAIDLDPDDPYIWSLRGSLKVQIDYNGNYIESAISDTSRAIEINSKIAEFYYRSGHAKACNDQIEDALYDLNKAIELDPHNKEGFLNPCQNLIKNLKGHNESFKEDGWGYVFLAKSLNSPDKYRIGTTTHKADLKRKVGKDSLVATSKECNGYKDLAIVIYRRYKRNRIGNSEYFLLDETKYNQVVKTITRSYGRDGSYGSGFLSDFFIE